MPNSQSSAAQVDTLLSSKTSRQPYRVIATMASIFGVTPLAFHNLLRSNRFEPYFRAMAQNITAWPQSSWGNSITHPQVEAQIVRDSEAWKHYAVLDTATALGSANERPAWTSTWTTIDWVAWATYNIENQLRLPQGVFHEVPIDHRQGRSKVFLAIQFCKQRKYAPDHFRADRVPDDDLVDEAGAQPVAADVAENDTAQEYDVTQIAMARLIASLSPLDGNAPPVGSLGWQYATICRAIQNVERPGVPWTHTLQRVPVPSSAIDEVTGEEESSGDRNRALEAESLEQQQATRLAWEEDCRAFEDAQRLAIGESYVASEADLDGVRKYEALLTTKFSTHFGSMSYEQSRDFILPDLGPGDTWVHANAQQGSLSLKSWQVTGVAGMWHRYQAVVNGTAPACGLILSDDTGLGKTKQMVAFISLLATRLGILSHDFRKPHLVLLPADLINAWIKELLLMDSRLTIYVYYGTNGSWKHAFGDRVKVVSNLQRSQFGNGTFAASLPQRSVFLSSLGTWATRHGPSAQASWQRSRNRPLTGDDLDDQWPGDLHGVFASVTVDEGHLVRNPETYANRSLYWLRDTFFVLATATPLPNSLRDVRGYAKLLQLSGSEASFQNNPRSDPFRLLGRQGYELKHCISSGVIDKFIFKLDDRSAQARRVKMVLDPLQIHRSYRSKDPKPHEDGLDREIGDAIPPLVNHVVELRHDIGSLGMYKFFEKPLLRKLYMPHPVTGEMTWNGAVYRQLALLSTALWFPIVEPGMKAIHTESWLAMENPLFELVKRIHAGWKKSTAEDPPFVIPVATDVEAQLSIIQLGSPKITAILKMVRKHILVFGHKIAFACAGPAMQMVLHCIFHALKIRASIFAAPLSRAERLREEVLFTMPPDEAESTMAWVAGFKLGSVGLNLQSHCHICVSVDSPLNVGQLKQFQGRIRRLGQTEIVRHVSLVTLGTWHATMMSRVDNKALLVDLVNMEAELQEMEVVDGGGGTGPVATFAPQSGMYYVDGVLTRWDDMTADQQQRSNQATLEDVVRYFQGLAQSTSGISDV